jgi:mannitol/fructose-specific phosphotransferase system IIA component (Ntr-type)
MLRDVLTPQLVTTNLEGASKRAVIESLVSLIEKGGGVKDRELALSDVLAHENENSTGMENGIAIPHAKTDAVDRLVACVGVSKGRIEFECLDRKPAHIFVMTLSPRDGTGPHVRFLAEVARLLKEADVRKRVLAAETDEELYQVFVD